MPAIKGDMYINTHCNYSQPTLIKLDNENIGGHLTPLHPHHVWRELWSTIWVNLIGQSDSTEYFEQCLSHCTQMTITRKPISTYMLLEWRQISAYNMRLWLFAISAPLLIQLRTSRPSWAPFWMNTTSWRTLLRWQLITVRTSSLRCATAFD